VSPDVPRARRLVEARLGRAPQDALEAAVVLEAWAGVPAQRALETARALMPARPAAPLVSSAAPAALSRPPRLLDGFPFVVAIAAIALWAPPLASALGVEVVRDALVLALPVTLALQWALACRHLARPSGLAGLAERRGTLVLTAAVLVFAATAALGRAGALAGLLVVTWTAGTVLIRRGWAAGYCTVVAAAVPAMLLDVPAPSVVAAVTVVTAAFAWWALRTAPAGRVIPARWSRTVGAGLTGAGVGVLLVADPTVTWTGSGAAPALALLPSALGALWAGQSLWNLAGAFPRALAGVSACAPRGSSPAPLDPTRGARRGLGRVTAAGPLPAVRGTRRERSDAAAASPRGVALAPARALTGAVWRLVVLTSAGSAALLVLTPWLGAGPSVVGVLAGYGVIALATLLAGLIDSLGRPSLAGAGVGAGVAAAVLVRAIGPPSAGAGLLSGGTVAVLVLLPAALVLLARPARTLATTLWIA
jgi:hypothetical protein